MDASSTVVHATKCSRRSGGRRCSLCDGSWKHGLQI